MVKRNFINLQAPKIESNVEEVKDANMSTLEKVFPLNCKDWFNKLPPQIRTNLGTRKFDVQVLQHINEKCRHPVKKSKNNCSKCKYEIDIENINMEDIKRNIDTLYCTKFCNFTDLEKEYNIASPNLIFDAMILRFFNDQDVIVQDEDWIKYDNKKFNNGVLNRD